MALATLPYPSMDFTPLDILTADELDQIVANIDAVNNATINTASIATGAITTVKVADGNITTAKMANDAITSAKIDWASMPVNYGTATPNTTQNYSSYDFGSYTITEAGVYLMVGGAFINVAGAYDRSIRIMKNGTEVIRKTQNSGSRQMFSIEYAGSFAVSDVVKFNISANASNFTPQLSPSWAIIKIGE